MKIEWPHDIDCPGECNCWVKEAKAYIAQLEAALAVAMSENQRLTKIIEDLESDYENSG